MAQPADPSPPVSCVSRLLLCIVLLCLGQSSEIGCYFLIWKNLVCVPGQMWSQLQSDSLGCTAAAFSGAVWGDWHAPDHRCTSPFGSRRFFAPFLHSAWAVLVIVVCVVCLYVPDCQCVLVSCTAFPGQGKAWPGSGTSTSRPRRPDVAASSSSASAHF